MATQTFHTVIRTRQDGNKFIIATACLTKINDQKPYFSVTAEIKEGVHKSYGCQHEEVLRYFPELAPLVALHLADDDGEPMYGLINGFYWIAGAAGGLGEEYHGGSGSSGRTPEECVKILGEHLRITTEEAQKIVDEVSQAANPKACWQHLYNRGRQARQVQAQEGIALLKTLSNSTQRG